MIKKLLCLGLLPLLTLGACAQKTDYYALLAKHSDFNREDAEDITFTYDFDDPRLSELNAKWGLSEIAGEGDTQTRALNLLHWLCAHTIKGNPQSVPEDLQMHAGGLLGWCFDRPGNDPNCKHLSIILSECLLAVDIKAYALWCFPKVYEGDNHVVVQVWLPEENRWVMLDPSFDLYVMDEAGRVLDTRGFREKLAGRAALRLNEERKWNGPEWGYFDYMAKDAFHFNRARDMRYGAVDEGAQWMRLCPAGYAIEGEESPLYASYSSFWN